MDAPAEAALRLLVVDDNPQYAEALQKLLLGKGYEVTLTSSTEEARRIFARAAPDAAFVALGAEDGFGLELLEAFHASDPLAVLVATTVREGYAEALGALHAGAVDLLALPIVGDALSTCLERVRQHVTVRRELEKTRIATGYERQRRLQVERELAQSTTDYQTVFHASRDALTVYDIETARLVDANEAAVKLFHAPSRKALLEWLSIERYSPERQPDGELSLPKVKRHIETAIRNGNLQYEWLHLRMDGTTFPCRVSMSCIELDGRQVLLSSRTDITESARQTAELEAREALFSSTLDALPVGVWVVGNDRMIRHANPAGHRIWCGEKPPTPGTPWRCDHGGEDVVERVLQTGRPILNAEEQYHTDDGRSRTILRSAVPARSASGGTSGVIVVNTDITQLKRMERQYQMFYQFAEHSPQPLVITDLKEIITYVNPAFCALYGYPAESVIGRTPRILNPGRAAYRELGIDDAEYDALFGTLRTALAPGGPGSWNGEVYNLTAHGDMRRIHLFVHTIYGENGQPFALAALPVDVTAVRGEEERIRIDAYSALADLAETRDNETGAHMKRIAAYSRLMGERLGMPRKYCRDIATFSPLHDIGKVGIPDNVLLAPRKLTPEEFAIIRQHTVLGFRILANRPQLSMAAEIAHYHHEKFDGSGYPDGLSGETIPMAARIAAIADVYDALRSRRPYKEPWSHARSAGYITEQSGTHFDPRLVRLFVQFGGEFDDIFNAHADEDHQQP